MKFSWKDIIFEDANKIIYILIGALLNAIALNFFLIPADVFASGFAGLGQLLSSVCKDFFGLSISTGIFVFLLNVPIAILAWFKIGPKFTIYSSMSVGLLSFFLEVIPVRELSSDVFLNAIFGGAIGAIGVALTLKRGASTGGLDVIAVIASRRADKPIGNYFLLFNGLIVVAAGFLYEWEQALYTMIALYVSSYVIDLIHTNHEKLTAMIVTSKGDVVKKAIHNELVRGITSLPSKGGYTNEEKEMLMIVLTRYELYDLQRIIKEVDPNAFTNIVETVGVFGQFRKSI
ncbi:MAG: YitT family protein [Bacilli bacterium]